MKKKHTFDITKPWSGHVPHASVVPNPEQPRKWFDEDQLEMTKESLKALQVQPVLVIPFTDRKRPHVAWMIVDGERRWRGLGKLKEKEILVCYRPGITQENLHSTSFAANFCRAGHTHAETAAAIERERGGGRTYHEIARMVGRTEQWVRNEHKLLKLHPELLALMDPPTPKNEKLATQLALLLADLPPFDQLTKYAKVKELSKSDAFHKLRTSAGVSHTAQRSPATDAKYLLGKCEAAERALTAVATVPLPMLNRLGEDHLPEVLAAINRAEAALRAARERIKERS